MTEELAKLDQIIARHGRTRDALLPILQAVQAEYGYLPEEALRELCERTEIAPADVAGVASFYTQFRHRPVGRHLIRVCHGTACHVKGASLVHEALERHLHLAAGEDTDPTGEFTLTKVACLGCCTLAPAMQIDDVTFGHLTPQRVPEVIGEFREYVASRGDAAASASRGRRQRSRAAPSQAEVRIGLGSCCVAKGSAALRRAVEEALAGAGAAAKVKRVGCVGMCSQTPLLEIANNGTTALYTRVSPADARAIVRRHFGQRGPVRRLAAAIGGALDMIMDDRPRPRPTAPDDGAVCSFLGGQMHLATENAAQTDPLDLDEYIAAGGFEALRRCVNALSPDAIIAEIAASGLAGRGGAGYPTGTKWAAVRAAAGERKYVICNGDEGDPGAFMDRMILESCPFRVIEGIAIAARAVGAAEGILYIRAEYPLAVRRVREALDACRERGLLGADMLGRGLSLDLRIVEGAGAFVCGEETALIASIEGRRGTPRFRPPFPAASGLNGLPTLINNVETYSLVPWIIRHGAQAFAAVGTAASKGTKVFALAGKVVRGGLVEVPMGTSIRRIVEEIGGGVASPAHCPLPLRERGDARRFKAVQIGGPSGGCLPAVLADTLVDYAALVSAGAIMGSGGLIVLDDEDCMVDVARYFLQFTQDQSCGKCTFCRIGTRRMLDVLDRLCAGDGHKGDLEHMERLAASVKAGSLCGLGRTAPNPVLTTLRYFRDEYEAHIAGRCPAGRCKALIRYAITEKCIGCTLCAQQCPAGAIPMTPYRRHVVDDGKCIRCGTCRQVCPARAVEVRTGRPETVRPETVDRKTG